MKYVKYTKEIIITILLTLIFVSLVDFVAINLILGCQSWDKNLWTNQHSCLTPYDIWEKI